QIASFTWDGNDAYGRTLQGRQLATITVGNVYDGVYDATQRFGYNGNGQIIGNRTRREVTLPVAYQTYLGNFSAEGLGLGGWMLNIHHFYDPVQHVLYYGTGQRRSVQTISTIMSTSAGGGSMFQDGAPATQTSFGQFSPQGVAVGPDGSVFAADTGKRVVRRIDSNGIINTIAGTPGSSCSDNTQPCGDGGPATQALLSSPESVAVGRDGSIYIADPAANRVRKVNPNGIISTVAGNGLPCNSPATDPCGDEGPATQA